MDDNQFEIEKMRIRMELINIAIHQLTVINENVPGKMEKNENNSADNVVSYAETLWDFVYL